MEIKGDQKQIIQGLFLIESKAASSRYENKLLVEKSLILLHINVSQNLKQI